MVSFIYICIHFFSSEAKAVVVGPTDIYIKSGSEVILTCIVSQGPHELGTIYWYRGKLYIHLILIYTFFFFQFRKLSEKIIENQTKVKVSKKNQCIKN